METNENGNDGLCCDGDSVTNLIINYLPQTLTDDEFRSMFLSIGPLKSCKIIRDRATGYSYGFGFVDYVNEADAERAIHTLNGLQLQNKRLKVALARSGEGVKGANLYIRNIPKDVNQDHLQEIFSQYGYIINCRVLSDLNSGVSKGVGFVLFEKRDQADAAIDAFDGKTLPGYSEVLSVKYADDNRGKARPPPIMGRVEYGGNYGGPYGPSSYGPPGPMRGQRGPGRGGRYNPMNMYSAPGMNSDEGYVLFVYNINPDADERFLWQLFAPFGAVQKVNVIKDYGKNQGKGYGFVTMTNYPEAMNAIQGLNGYRRHGGKPLQVSFKTSKN